MKRDTCYDPLCRVHHAMSDAEMTVDDWDLLLHRLQQENSEFSARAWVGRLRGELDKVKAAHEETRSALKWAIEELARVNSQNAELRHGGSAPLPPVSGSGGIK